MQYILLFSQAGIKPENLTIALEPEAVSMFCQYMKYSKEDASCLSLDILESETKYMVVDLGGNCLENQIYASIYVSTVLVSVFVICGLFIYFFYYFIKLKLSFVFVMRKAREWL